MKSYSNERKPLNTDKTLASIKEFLDVQEGHASAGEDLRVLIRIVAQLTALREFMYWYRKAGVWFPSSEDDWITATLAEAIPHLMDEVGRVRCSGQHSGN